MGYHFVTWGINQEKQVIYIHEEDACKALSLAYKRYPGRAISFATTNEIQDYNDKSSHVFIDEDNNYRYDNQPNIFGLFK